MASDYTLLYENGSTQVVSQFQNGTLLLSDNGETAIFSASAADGKMGKSALSTRFDPVMESDPQLIEVRFEFMIPEGGTVNSIIIADFESSCPEFGTNPGIRVYLRDGYLRVDRSKIGESDPFYANQEFPIEAGNWNDIQIKLIPGVDGAGFLEIYLDGVLVLSETGNNVISDEMRDSFGLPLGQSYVDRFQVGLTSNSTDMPASVAISNLEFTVNDQVIVDGLEAAIQVADAVYQTDTENDLVLVEENPGTDFFGLAVTGTADDGILMGTRWDDEIAGGAGADTIYGGGGNDVLSGGEGSDTFVFQVGMGNDTIVDFAAGEDLILFDFTYLGLDDGFPSFEPAPADIRVNDTSEGTLVHIGNDSFLLVGVAMSDLTIDDFQLL